MFCHNCGNELPEGAKFCASCGTAVETAAEEVVTEEVVAEEVKTEAVTSEAQTTEENTTQERAAEENVAQENATQENPWTATQAQPQPAYQPTTNRSNLQWFSIVIAVLFAFQVLGNIFVGLRSFFGGIASLFRWYGIHWAIIEFVTAVLSIGAALAALLVAATLFSVFQNWKQEKAKKCFTLVLGGSVLFALLFLVRTIISGVNYYSFSMYLTDGELGKLIWCLILAGGATVGFYLLAKNEGADPAAGGYAVAEELKAAPASVKEVLDTVMSSSNKANPSGETNIPNQPTGTGNLQGATPAYNNGGNNQMNGALKTDRSIWLYILLGICTCGIYGLYLMYTMERDINIACQGDGDETPSFWVYLVLSIVTCGIYHYYYVYKMGNRLQRNAARYGLSMQENGTSVLMWCLFGLFLCGIGSFVGINILLENTNAICREYNAYNNL